MECYCDSYSWPYWAETRKASKPHKCSECRRCINPGEEYEHVRGKCEGDMFIEKTCADCLRLRRWVMAHVPCACLSHGNMLEEMLETVREYAHNVPGMWMEFGRMYVQITRKPLPKAVTGRMLPDRPPCLLETRKRR